MQVVFKKFFSVNYPRNLFQINKMNQQGSRKVFVCPRSDCRSKFSTNTRLKFHIENVHEENKDTFCHTCQRRFSSRHALIRHNNIKHLGVRDHVYSHCGKQFTNPTDLRSHVRQHHSLLKLKCDRCDDGFGYKSSLSKHLEVCGKTTKDMHRMREIIQKSKRYAIPQERYTLQRGVYMWHVCQMLQKKFNNLLFFWF